MPRDPLGTEHALRMLDFGEVRAAVVAHIRYGPAIAMAEALSPSFDPSQVRLLCQQTAQARNLLSEAVEVDLALAEDPSDAVVRAALGGIMSGPELIKVGEAIRVQARAASLSVKAKDIAPAISAMACSIPDLRDVEVAIRRSISESGEVLDSATPKLGALRLGVRRSYEQVTRALSGLIDSDESDVLQDRVISLRSDRLCLQVRSEMRHRVPGIVHDASNSGATVYVEPLATVELGNSWREAALAESREVALVLAQLSSMVSNAADAFAAGSEITAQIDLVLARARYAVAKGGVPAAESDWRCQDPGVTIVDARHPLLGSSTVPMSLRLGLPEPVLVITGPNTGGKTVAMKTVGLLAAMNQAGLQVPAGSGTSLPIFDSIWVELGDGQSVERGASTFGSHMARISQILAGAGPRSLVLLDELGSSTDPEEGAALARAILDCLAERNIHSVVTTHHRSVAAHAAASNGMGNASVELDHDTLQPNYRLTMGAPGRSYAMSIAAGLGLSEAVLSAARSYLDPRSVQYDRSIERLERSSEAAEEALARAEGAAESAERARVELQAERAAMELRRAEIADAMHSELSGRHGELLRKLRRAEAALSWTVPAAHSGDREVLDAVAADLSQAREALAAVESEISQEAEANPAACVRVGDEVEVRGLGAAGTVSSLDVETGEAEVAMGNVKLRVDPSRLIPTGQRADPEPTVVSTALGPALGTVELDLRGMRAEGAEVELDLFLDRALRDGLSTVRIIHGRATGVLRRVVRERLDGHPLVRSYEAERPGPGGDGATVVDLV